MGFPDAETGHALSSSALRWCHVTSRAQFQTPEQESDDAAEHLKGAHRDRCCGAAGGAAAGQAGVHSSVLPWVSATPAPIQLPSSSLLLLTWRQCMMAGEKGACVHVGGLGGAPGLPVALPWLWRPFRQ